MNAPSETKSPSPGHPEDPHLGDERENPCARIYCRGRKLLPTVCDGTCQPCRGERERYIEMTAQNHMRRINADPSRGDSLEHDEESITYERAISFVRREMSLLDGRKAGYIERTELFARLIASRVETTRVTPLPQSDPGAHD